MQGAQEVQDEQGVVVSGEISNIVFQQLVCMLEEIIDEDTQIAPSKILEDFKLNLQTNQEIANEIDINLLFGPIIQSRNFDEMPYAKNDSQALLFQNITIMLGVSVSLFSNSYYAFSGRTILVNPVQEQEYAYKLAIDTLNVCLANFKIGNEAREVYNRAKLYAQEANPTLAQYFGNNVGFILEKQQLKEYNAYINENIELEIQNGTVAALSVTFKNIPKPKSSSLKTETFSIFLCDTVMLQGSQQIIATQQKKSYSDITYFLDEGNEESESKED